MGLFEDLPVRFLDLLGISVDPKKVRFLKLEFPEFFKKEPDLVFEYRGKIYHIEIQSEDNPKVSLRMAYYYLLILENYEKTPEQFMFFIGEKSPKRIKPFVKTPNLEYYYTLIDINRLDCSEILENPPSNNWILAILCKLGKDANGVKKILKGLSQIKDSQKRKRQFKTILQMANFEVEKLDILTDFKYVSFAERDLRNVGNKIRNLKPRNPQ